MYAHMFQPMQAILRATFSMAWKVLKPLHCYSWL